MNKKKMKRRIKKQKHRIKKLKKEISVCRKEYRDLLEEHCSGMDYKEKLQWLSNRALKVLERNEKDEVSSV